LWRLHLADAVGGFAITGVRSPKARHALEQRE
jgi:hypothetical protein